MYFGGGAGGSATISANAFRVSNVSGNDHCLRSGFHRCPGIFFSRAKSASEKRISVTHTRPSVPVSIVSAAIFADWLPSRSKPKTLAAHARKARVNGKRQVRTIWNAIITASFERAMRTPIYQGRSQTYNLDYIAACKKRQNRK
jgi:hypothetical protein